MVSATGRNRLVFGSMAAIVIAAGLFSGTTLSGDVNADVVVERTPFGPARLGVEGGLGESGRRRASQPIRPVVVLGGTAPYNGPTRQELDAFNEVRAATAEMWQGAHEAMGEVVPGGEFTAPPPPPPPPMALGGRRLTPYEIDELHRTARRIRGEDVPSPVGTQPPG